MATLDAFDARRMVLFALFFVLSLSCREDVSIGLALFGLALVLSGNRPRAGIVIFLTSASYFVALRFVVMPAVGTSGHAELYKGLFPDGMRTFSGVVLTILSNPVFTLKTMITTDKLRYLLQILLPLAFLPLRRAWLAASLAPGGNPHGPDDELPARRWTSASTIRGILFRMSFPPLCWHWSWWGPSRSIGVPEGPPVLAEPGAGARFGNAPRWRR